MSKIQEKLDSLQPYIVGIRYLQGMQIVDAVFKEGWNIPNSDVIKKELVDESQNYYMFFTDKEGVTIDDLLDYVEGIININIEREKKHTLLKSKVKELQIIFKDNPLTKLERLKFSFGEPDIVPSLTEMDINLDDEEYQTKEQVDTPPPTEKIKITNNVAKAKGQKVELPPKPDKIEVETHELPPEMTEGECECGPSEACAKCMDEKSLV